MHTLSLPPGPDATTVPIPEVSDPWMRLGERLRRRKKLFLTVFLSFVALVVVWTALTPRTYTTQVKLIAGSPAGAANSNGGTTNLPILNALLETSGVQSAETYAELVQETPVAQRVIDDLHLNTTPAGLLSHVAVKPITNTSIIALNATWRDPETSAKIANAFAQAFVDRERELVASSANAAVDFLKGQIPSVEKRLRASEDALTKYESKHHLADITAQTTGAVNAIGTVEGKIAQTQLDQKQADAQIGSLTAQLSRLSATTSGGGSTAPNPVVGQLQTQLAQAQVQLNAARQQYTDSHPTVIALRQQVAQLRRQIAQQPATIVSSVQTISNPVYQQLSQQLAAARAASASSASQLAQLKTQHAALTPMLASLPVEGARLASLQREKKLSEDLYNALQQKLNDATVVKTSAISDVTITQPADPSAAGVRPSWTLNIVLAIFIGLLLASTTVLVIEYFDRRLRTSTDVERDLGLPVLAQIPNLGSGEGENPDMSVESEPFLELVTQLRYASETPYRSIAITSPNKGDGKSTIATNVAIALGEIVSGGPADALPAPRILLVDADLRRPSLHRRLSLRNDRGLSDILVGRATLEEVVQPSGHPGVDVLTSGTASRNPIKLLQSERFDRVLEHAKERYATVILDAPAALPVIDAAILGAKAGATIMVASSGNTDINAIKLALQRLHSVGVRDFVGVVLNRVALEANDYSDYFADLVIPPPKHANGKTPTLPSAPSSEPAAEDVPEPEIVAAASPEPPTVAAAAAVAEGPEPAAQIDPADDFAELETMSAIWAEAEDAALIPFMQGSEDIAALDTLAAATKGEESAEFVPSVSSVSDKAGEPPPAPKFVLVARLQLPRTSGRRLAGEEVASCRRFVPAVAAEEVSAPIIDESAPQVEEAPANEPLVSQIAIDEAVVVAPIAAAEVLEEPEEADVDAAAAQRSAALAEDWMLLNSSASEVAMFVRNELKSLVGTSPASR